MWNGRPYPLGAAFDGEGTNFALFTEVAERVDLRLVVALGGMAEGGGPPVVGVGVEGVHPRRRA
ncbi:hypothetical protein, partial [Streptomyces sp. NPDC058476]|uniref:hypothetical protein n=1 Tax=Streptomyces sp. NPDC058476 TaxID=3346519 RepID=UPI00365F896E